MFLSCVNIYCDRQFVLTMHRLVVHAISIDRRCRFSAFEIHFNLTNNFSTVFSCVFLFTSIGNENENEMLCNAMKIKCKLAMQREENRKEKFAMANKMIIFKSSIKYSPKPKRTNRILAAEKRTGKKTY